jgi:hypothetical protein
VDKAAEKAVTMALAPPGSAKLDQNVPIREQPSAMPGDE